MKTLAVYCGSATGTPNLYSSSTKAFAHWMVEHQFDLVYGGGAIGLMGVLADTILGDGGHVTGVMPTFLTHNERAHKSLTHFFIVDDMHERKIKMSELADGYIALPGGPGTLEEISEMVSWGRIGQHHKPCIFYNINGYYDLLALFFDQMVEQGFLTQKERQQIFFTDSLEDMYTFLHNN